MKKSFVAGYVAATAIGFTVYADHCPVTFTLEQARQLAEAKEVDIKGDKSTYVAPTEHRKEFKENLPSGYQLGSKMKFSPSLVYSTSRDEKGYPTCVYTYNTLIGKSYRLIIEESQVPAKVKKPFKLFDLSNNDTWLTNKEKIEKALRQQASSPNKRKTEEMILAKNDIEAYYNKRGHIRDDGVSD